MKQDPRACDYSGSEPAGRFLRDILKLGATRDWRQLMREATGEDIGPRAMLDFFQPVIDDLAKRNRVWIARAAAETRLETNRLESDQVHKGGAAGANGRLVE